MTSRSSILRWFAGVALLGAVGCAAHPARPAFRAAVWIGDRGISIPLPPPSIFEAPTQKVDVEGEVVGEDEALALQGVVAHVVDLRGEAVADVAIAPGETGFVVEGISIDLTDNCLEVWLQADDGAESEHALFSAAVVVAEDGTEGVEVSSGCEE